MLKDISVDSVKIDRSFVQYVTEVNDTAAIVTAVSQLGNKMHLNVIAEGVENQLQKSFLVSAGCSHLQGYLFSRPVPVEVLRNLLGAEMNLSRDTEAAIISAIDNSNHLMNSFNWHMAPVLLT